MRKGIIISILIAMHAALCAQVRLDRPLVLDGEGDASRRVTGLSDPQHADQALPAGTLRKGTYHFTTAPDGDAWDLLLQPASPGPTPGMELLIMPSTDNEGPVTIQLDGTDPVALVKDGAVPLVPGDIRAGRIVSVVFDGEAFQLTSGTDMRPRPCPNGAVPLHDRVCMEVDERPEEHFPQAAAICGAAGGRLCSWGEMYYGCSRSEQLGTVNMVGNWEWTNNTANGDGLVRVVGFSSCTHANTSPHVGSTPRNFRCCYRR